MPKCLFTTGFEVNLFLHLLHTDIFFFGLGLFALCHYTSKRRLHLPGESAGPTKLRIAEEIVPIAAKKKEGENVQVDEGGFRFY